jgi:predicted transcriptional regulator of viral defense system
LNPVEAVMKENEALDFSVVERVATHAPVSFEELQRLFKDHSWNQLFAATDRLSRKGALAVRRVDRGTYLISLGPQFTIAPEVTQASSSTRTES